MASSIPLPHIRAAVSSDAAALAILARATFCDTFAHLYAVEDLDAYLAGPLSDASTAAMIGDPDKLVRVAEGEDDALIGFCVLNLTLTLDYNPAPRRALELSKLYLTNDAKGTGLADAFMAWVDDEASARRCNEIALSVYCDNVRAQRFYARHGYAKFADSFFMVGNHRDEEFLYRKDVTPRP
jgi:diamine N-acetyltransferase